MSKRIMVIDDDRGIRNFLAKALAAKGMQADLADRGAVGLQKIIAGDYDLVLMDINMPEISGPALCRSLRNLEKTRDLPVVMMTAMFHSTEQIEQAKQDYGATQFLLKPFVVEDLYWLLDKFFPRVSAAAPVKPEEGQLDEFSLAALLNRMYGQKRTGVLNLRRGETKKVVYFKGGYPIFARSNILGECLGHLLVRDGAISAEDCDRSIQLSKASGRLQGTVLIEMGLLSPEQLHAALTRQVSEKLLTIFAWSEGGFQFTPATQFKKNVTEIDLSPAALIYQGVSRYWPPERLQKFLGEHRTHYLGPAKNPLFRFQDMRLSRRGETLFEECLGDLTLEQVLKRFPLSRREAQQTLAALLAAGMVIATAEPLPLDQRGKEKRRKEQPLDETLRAKILEDYNRILQADYFAALGLERDCSQQDARRAYYRLVKAYHPDRFLGQGLSQDMERKVSEIFQYLSHAYSVLSDKEASASYLDELVNGPKRAVNVSQVIEAESAYQRGKTLLRVRRYKEAGEYLHQAVELSAKEPEYLTHYGWAIFKAQPTQLEAQKRALEVLQASRDINPRMEHTHLYLGYVYRALNRERHSEKSFELAIQINPRCTEALRELRLLNLRKKQSGEGGLFRKLLGRKKD